MSKNSTNETFEAVFWPLYDSHIYLGFLEGQSDLTPKGWLELSISTAIGIVISIYFWPLAIILYFIGSLIKIFVKGEDLKSNFISLLATIVIVSVVTSLFLEGLGILLGKR